MKNEKEKNKLSITEYLILASFIFFVLFLIIFLIRFIVYFKDLSIIRNNIYKDLLQDEIIKECFSAFWYLLKTYGESAIFIFTIFVCTLFILLAVMCAFDRKGENKKTRINYKYDMRILNINNSKSKNDFKLTKIDPVIAKVIKDHYVFKVYDDGNILVPYSIYEGYYVDGLVICKNLEINATGKIENIEEKLFEERDVFEMEEPNKVFTDQVKLYLKEVFKKEIKNNFLDNVFISRWKAVVFASLLIVVLYNIFLDFRLMSQEAGFSNLQQLLIVLSNNFIFIFLLLLFCGLFLNFSYIDISEMCNTINLEFIPRFYKRLYLTKEINDVKYDKYQIVFIRRDIFEKMKNEYEEVVKDNLFEVSFLCCENIEAPAKKRLLEVKWIEADMNIKELDDIACIEIFKNQDVINNTGNKLFKRNFAIPAILLLSLVIVGICLYVIKLWTANVHMAGEVKKYLYNHSIPLQKAEEIMDLMPAWYFLDVANNNNNNHILTNYSLAETAWNLSPFKIFKKLQVPKINNFDNFKSYVNKLSYMTNLKNSSKENFNRWLSIVKEIEKKENVILSFREFSFWDVPFIFINSVAFLSVLIFIGFLFLLFDFLILGIIVKFKLAKIDDDIEKVLIKVLKIS
ncbi:hypothetical protein Calkr_2507 [Caldicellulosiruptor acetigenus I77R1B]|uniref:Uncharacterized protein n=1 Tax=Caldicellulosiruptor acetigenus (strain ATCC 700853 / DSM 12137 / I77R1B) TaxID=632335 RepID=E4S8F6_CALA7|nr:hypothetical protein [Caldicellulosiruptor acetigenus]ADQ41938.1 hypothetical protein Calkr_2507 [Caldicellulosiruptor acetigenus I77R1B]